MWDDFYNEGPSDFDIAIEEFKEGLRKAVKDEYVREMTRLKKENEELQEVKKNFEKIKQDYEDKKRAFEYKEDELMRQCARKKIEELLDVANDMKAEVYTIDYTYGNIPKCDKCDDNREIHFTSPSGKDCKEDCPICGQDYVVYYPVPIKSLRLRFTKDPCIECRPYYIKYESYGETTVYDRAAMYNGEAEDFDLGDNYGYRARHTYFESKELAQKICDRINKKNNVPDNVEIKEKCK